MFGGLGGELGGVWMKSVRCGIVALLVLISLSATALAVKLPGQPTTPSESLPYNLALATGATAPDTVVIVVAEPSDYNIIAIADIVANKVGAPVLITPPDKLSNYVIETVTQMLAYGSLEKAIVIGTDANTTSIADLVRDIREPITGKEITLVNVIYAGTTEELSNKAAIYTWDNSSAVIVADGYIQADVAKAILMSAVDGIPVIYEQAGTDTIYATANLLGATTIYVTPAVDPDTISTLETNFTVNDTWHGLSSDLTLEEFVIQAQTTSKNATIVVVKESDLTPYDEFIYAMSVFSQANVSIVVAKNSTTLGANQTTFLQSESPSVVVVLGDTSVATETLTNTIAATVSKAPWRIVYDDRIEEMTELALAASNYYYPIVVTTYTQSNNTFTYKFKNIGFSDVIKFDTYSLKVTFTKSSGDFIDSNPYPAAQNSTVVVYEFKDPIYPHDYVVLLFTVTEGANFSLVPKLDYYGYTLAGTVKPISSFYDYIASYFEKAKSWFAEMFYKFVGVLSVYIPLPNYAVMAIAAFITFIIIWSLVGFIIYIPVVAIKREIKHPIYYGLIAWAIEKIRR